MSSNLISVEHHKQEELCKTRPVYRQGRKLTAVKVYTVNSESQHLFIYGVPQISLRTELKRLFSRHGKILNIHVVTNYETVIFTECYHVQFERIQSARIAKRLLDNRSFYGGILHVCYAPEYETVKETESKLNQRKCDVLNRISEKSNPPIPTMHSGTPTKKNKVSKKPETVSTEIEKHFNIPDIYKEDDPILRNWNKFSPAIAKKMIFYGPHASIKQYTLTHQDIKTANTQNMIPVQVIKKNAEKRIVFKNKNL